MIFCPQCGTTLEVTATRPPEHYRSEKAEKQEKDEKEEKMEKEEKTEKHEKQEYNVLGSLIGGSILILVGIMFYLAVAGFLNLRSIFPFFLIIIGVIVILGVAIGTVRARGRHPRP
jgi:F0F1-type ATP synthase assembly protein I